MTALIDSRAELDNWCIENVKTNSGDLSIINDITQLDIYDLYRLFKLTTGVDGDRRWSPNTLRSKVNLALDAYQTRVYEKHLAAQREQAAREALMAKIEKRGNVYEFVSQADDTEEVFEGDQQLRHYMRDVTYFIDQFKAKTHPKFIATATEQPLYALEWGESFIQHAVKMEIAQDLINKFDIGYTLSQIREYLTTRALNEGQYRSQSTSVMTNLIKASRSAAYAQLALTKYFM